MSRHEGDGRDQRRESKQGGEETTAAVNEA